MTWKLYADGADLCCLGIATWFGGASDPDDNGETASGLSTSANPDFLGCALPIPTCDATKGSPLPVLPYLRTWVKVIGTQTIYVPLIDVGPALSVDHCIDLTRRAFVMAGGNLDEGVLNVSYRIFGAGQFFKATGT